MKSYSQSGEDVIAWQYFKEKSHGYFIEVGANDPVLFSQTWFFEKRGWRGMLVEPLPQKAAILRSARPGSVVYGVAATSPGHPDELMLHIAPDDMFSSVEQNFSGNSSANTQSVPCATLDELLAREGNPSIDYLSIDVEGYELAVLSGFSLERHRPALILLEDHMKHLRLHRYMTGHGYRLVKRTGVNNWYVPAVAGFALSTWRERIWLKKRLWLHTPFAVLREWLRFIRRRSGAVVRAAGLAVYVAATFESTLVERRRVLVEGECTGEMMLDRVEKFATATSAKGEWREPASQTLRPRRPVRPAVFAARWRAPVGATPLPAHASAETLKS